MKQVKKKKVVSDVQMFVGTITVNGGTVADIDYRRTVYTDGTVEERGVRPTEGFAAALAKIGEKQRTDKPKRRRRT